MTEPLFQTRCPVFKVDGEVKGELARDLGASRSRRPRGPEDADGAPRRPRSALRTRHEEAQLYLDGAILDFGKKLEGLARPARGDQRTVFEGVVSALEAAFQEGESPR